MEHLTFSRLAFNEAQAEKILPLTDRGISKSLATAATDFIMEKVRELRFTKDINGFDAMEKVCRAYPKSATLMMRATLLRGTVADDAVSDYSAED